MLHSRCRVEARGCAESIMPVGTRKSCWDGSTVFRVELPSPTPGRFLSGRFPEEVKKQ